MYRPSRRTGIPERDRNLTDNHAEKSCNHGIKPAPKGTAKKRKARGNSKLRAISAPSAPQTKPITNKIRLNCSTTAVEVRFPSTQPRAATISANVPRILGVGLKEASFFRRA